jgi:hypothetical protein
MSFFILVLFSLSLLADALYFMPKTFTPQPGRSFTHILALAPADSGAAGVRGVPAA